MMYIDIVNNKLKCITYDTFVFFKFTHDNSYHTLQKEYKYISPYIIYRLYIHIFNCTYENRNTNFYHQYIISYILIYERTFFYISPKYNILPWFVYKPGCSSNKSSFFISFFNSACLPLMSSKTISYTELLILS